MTVDLQVFDYKILSQVNEPPTMLDWEAMGVKDDPEAFNKQFLKWGCEVSKIEQGHTISIYSTIGIPCKLIHSFYVPDGNFYRYKNSTTFFVAMHELEPITSAEMATAHFGKVAAAIMLETLQKSGGHQPYIIQLPSTSKLMLQLEFMGATSV